MSFEAGQVEKLEVLVVGANEDSPEEDTFKKKSSLAVEVVISVGFVTSVGSEEFSCGMSVVLMVEVVSGSVASEFRVGGLTEGCGEP